MKVFSWVEQMTPTERQHFDLQTYQNQARCVVAVPTQIALRELTGFSRGYVRDYVSETFNEQDVAQAMTEPGRVHLRPLDDRNAGWLTR